MARRPRVKPTPPPEPTPPPPTPPITGGAGNDTLIDKLWWVREANTTNDRITGGAGDDNITSTGGIDFIDGGTGTDLATVFLDQFAGNLTVTGQIGSGQTATFSNGTVITNVEQTFLHFGAGNDNVTFNSGQYISAGDGNDRITLTAGNGIINGGRGDDILTGGIGNDIQRGEDGNDRLKGNAGDDELDGGNGDDIVEGGIGNDRIGGGFGADRVDGGDGDDRLSGGGGADILIGGAGADFFGIADGIATGVQYITDFNYAEGDRIDAWFQFFDPESVDGSQPETVAASIVSDPVAQGFLTVTQAVGGVFVALTSNPGAGLLLANISLETLPPDFLI